MSLADELRHGAVLVAVSGESDATGAMSLAHALEQRYGAAVLALQVKDRARSSGFGTPAQEILRYAEQKHTALIAMGLRRHGIVDRVLHRETTLAVARSARTPILGVVPELRGLPRRAVAGIDFEPACVRAARAALDIVARPVSHAGAALRLAYVDRSRIVETRADVAGDALIDAFRVQTAFEQLIRDLNAPPYVCVDWTVLYGSPNRKLLDFAGESEADLIAVGGPRHERVERRILGSVTTAIIRDGRISVLVVPS